DNSRGAAEIPADRLNIDDARAVHADLRNGATESTQKLARLQRGGMLGRAGDDVGTLGPAAEDAAQLDEHRSLEGLVARLAAAARETNLIRLSAEQGRDLRTGIF